jgi:hypothetical protein
MSEETLSLRKAAAHLGVPVSTFCGVVKSGRGPRYVRIGNVYRFAVGDLNQYRDDRTFGGTQ